VPAEVTANVIFGSKRRASPYLTALQELLTAPRAHRLEFDNPGARNQVIAQAKKHHIEILCGEGNGKLYVKLREGEKMVGPAQQVAQQLVISWLRADGPRTAGEIEEHLKRLGHKSVVLKDFLGSLADQNLIVLRDHGTLKKWVATKGLAVAS